jgi:chromosome segregation ATPase
VEQARSAILAASDGEPERTAPGPEHSGELQSLKKQIEELRDQLGEVEARAKAAEHEAHRAREEVLRLRDQVVAAERDQQDLRTARARLTRLKRRGLLGRILNR